MTTITDGFTFIDTKFDPKSIILPYPVGLGPKLYFIKDTGNAYINNITIAGRKDQNGNTVRVRVAQWVYNIGYVVTNYTNGQMISVQSNLIPISPISQNSRCIILYSNGNDEFYYCVGDHLPEVDFTKFDPSIAPYINFAWKDALANTINFCDVSSNNTAYVKLPIPTSGDICIIIATSTNTAQDITLLIVSNDSGNVPINGEFSGLTITMPGNTVYPSATFISDGTSWYSIGTTGKNINNKISTPYYNGTWSRITQPLSYTNMLFGSNSATSYTYMPYLSAFKKCGGITIHVNNSNGYLGPDVSAQLIIPNNTGPNSKYVMSIPKLSVIWYATVSDNNVPTKYYPIIFINGYNGSYI